MHSKDVQQVQNGISVLCKRSESRAAERLTAVGLLFQFPERHFLGTTVIDVCCSSRAGVQMMAAEKLPCHDEMDSVTGALVSLSYTCSQYCKELLLPRILFVSSGFLLFSKVSYIEFCLLLSCCARRGRSPVISQQF